MDILSRPLALDMSRTAMPVASSAHMASWSGAAPTPRAMRAAQRGLVVPTSADAPSRSKGTAKLRLVSALSENRCLVSREITMPKRARVRLYRGPRSWFTPAAFAPEARADRVFSAAWTGGLVPNLPPVTRAPFRRLHRCVCSQ